MATIGDRIKELRIEKELSQEELGKAIGVQKAAIYKYENGLVVNLKQSVIGKLADVLGVAPSYLMGWEDAPASLASADKDEFYSAADKIPVVMIPIIGDVAAGVSMLARENIEGYHPAPSTRIKEGSSYFYLHVHGDSMSPEINDDDLALIRKQDNLENGQLGVFLIDQCESVIKRVKFEENKIELLSINPHYPPRPFVGREMARLLVVGKLVGVERKYD